jgi:hypothetical protein
VGPKVRISDHRRNVLTVRHLIDELTDYDRDPNVHLFNSFFYTKISSKDQDKKYVPHVFIADDKAAEG